MRRTKIVATLGPATEKPDVLAEIIRAGLDVARLNFSHGSADEMRERAAGLRRVAAAEGRYVALLGDLQGPKIRIRRFQNGSEQLARGASFFLDPDLDADAGTDAGVGIAYEGLATDVEPGDMLLLSDGQIELEVTGIEGNRVHTRVVIGGVLSDHKGINLRGGGLSAPALTDKDREDILLAAELDFDYLAVSFVRTAADIEEARRLFREAGGEGLMVAKIERAEAVAEIDSIIEASDVVMVARGDLGVEMGFAELTGLQKRIISRTRQRNRIAITATQMMESMISSAMPTRAEVSDVANAVIDGTDAVMLSAESAVGQYPVEAVRAMAEVCVGAEKYGTAGARRRERVDDTFRYVDEAIAMAVMFTANHLAVKAIIALTESGSTARWMSRVRSDIPIYAFTRHERTRRRVVLYRGVYPVSFDITHTDAQSVYREVFDLMLGRGLVEEGDLVIFTKGDMTGVQGGTNAMKILRVVRGD
ncbi:MAG TPA: pyruvate kinase [Woeseiaceae bacterium]|nr:pyruvate kinase [Woeseiaceae bacterium]